MRWAPPAAKLDPSGVTCPLLVARRLRREQHGDEHKGGLGP